MRAYGCIKRQCIPAYFTFGLVGVFRSHIVPTPFEVAGNGGIAHCISRMDIGLNSPIPFYGNATPILFNNRQQNQKNKNVVRKCPPIAFETKKRCCPSVGLSYRIFQIGGNNIYNHLTTTQVANWRSGRTMGPIVSKYPFV